MFETNMDEYLDEEVESVKLAFDVICQGWDREVGLLFPSMSYINLPFLNRRRMLLQLKALGNLLLRRIRRC